MLRPFPDCGNLRNRGVAAAVVRPSLRPYSPNGRPPDITKYVRRTRADHELCGSEKAQ